jgi:hypothetical protein
MRRADHITAPRASPSATTFDHQPPDGRSQADNNRTDHCWVTGSQSYRSNSDERPEHEYSETDVEM